MERYLEGILDQVLFAAELKLLKVLVPKLPQNTSNVLIECVWKLKHRYSLCDQPLVALVCLFYCFGIVFSIGCSRHSNAIYGCSSLRATPGITLYRSNTGETFLQLFFKVAWLKTIWKVKKIPNMAYL